MNLQCGSRLDTIVDDFLVVEVKAVDSLAGIHHAQLLTYMKLAESLIGLLMNFKVKLLKDLFTQQIMRTVRLFGFGAVALVNNFASAVQNSPLPAKINIIFGFQYES